MLKTTKIKIIAPKIYLMKKILNLRTTENTEMIIWIYPKKYSNYLNYPTKYPLLSGPKV